MPAVPTFLAVADVPELLSWDSEWELPIAAMAIFVTGTLPECLLGRLEMLAPGAL